MQGGLTVCLIAVYSVHAHIPEKIRSALLILVGSICSCKAQAMAHQSVISSLFDQNTHLSLS